MEQGINIQIGDLGRYLSITTSPNHPGGYLYLSGSPDTHVHFTAHRGQVGATLKEHGNRRGSEVTGDFTGGYEPVARVALDPDSETCSLAMRVGDSARTTASAPASLSGTEREHDVRLDPTRAAGWDFSLCGRDGLDYARTVADHVVPLWGEGREAVWGAFAPVRSGTSQAG